MSQFPPCPSCQEAYTYQEGDLLVCPMCSHEWNPANSTASTDDEPVKVIKDANGQVLVDGDAVTLIKDLKVKGSSMVIKAGTKVKNIRIVDGDHDIDCKVDGINMMLKSEFLKKA